MSSIVRIIIIGAGKFLRGKSQSHCFHIHVNVHVHVHVMGLTVACGEAEKVYEGRGVVVRVEQEHV